MVTEANNERWPVTAEDRRRCVEAMLEIATDTADPRPAIQAAKVLIQMTGQNQADEQFAARKGDRGEVENRILEILARARNEASEN